MSPNGGIKVYNQKQIWLGSSGLIILMVVCVGCGGGSGRVLFNSQTDYLIYVQY